MSPSNTKKDNKPAEAEKAPEKAVKKSKAEQTSSDNTGALKPAKTAKQGNTTAKQVKVPSKEHAIKASVENTDTEKLSRHESQVAEKPEVKSEKTEKAAKPAAQKQAQKKNAPALAQNYVPRLKKFYDEQAVKKLKEIFNYKNVMAIPRLVKVVVNVGVGDATQDKSVIDPVYEEITLITGQRAVKTYAKKSISNFHLREGMPIGVKVNLRGKRMYDFIDKLINVALPRVRDFKGLDTNSFDGRGNYSIGFKEQLIFPEIDYDKIKKIRGMDLAIVTTARSDDECYQFLKIMGFPFMEK